MVTVVAGLRSACLEIAAVVSAPWSLTAFSTTICGIVSPVSRPIRFERMSIAWAIRRIAFITASALLIAVSGLLSIIAKSSYNRNHLNSNDFCCN